MLKVNISIVLPASCYVSAWVIFFLAITALHPILAAQTEPTTAVKQAHKLDESGKTEEAMRILRQTLDAHPADLEARLALAAIYAGNHESSNAEQEFREALRLHPESSLAALAVGRFYIDNRSFSAAEQVLGETVRRYPKLNEPRFELATALAGEHKYKEAAANLRLVLAPSDATSRVRYFRLMASIQSGLGDSHAASRAIEGALAVMPKDPELQVLAALTEANAGEWTACAVHITPVFAANPTTETGLLLLHAQLASHQDFRSTLKILRGLSGEQELELKVRTAELLASAEQHVEAAHEFQDALGIAGGHDPMLLYNLAVELYAGGNAAEALTTLNSLRGLQDSAQVEDLAADIEERLGNRSAALGSRQAAVSLAPKEEQYRLSLGVALLQGHAFESAAEVFQQATNLFPGSDRAYVGLGTAEYLMEKYDESATAFLQADQLDGGSGRALGYLGATQVESPVEPSPAAVGAICGRADSRPTNSIPVIWCGALLFRKAYLAGDQLAAQEAIVRLRRAITLAPRDAGTNCRLGYALSWTGRPLEARHWLEICTRLKPESAEDHYRLSRVYQQLNLRRAAAEQIDLATKLSTAQDQRETVAQKLSRELLEVPGRQAAKQVK